MNTSVTSSSLLQSLDDWLHHLNNLHHQDIDLGLERIGQVADKLDLRQSNARIILVAGTNGKGTTSRFLESYLINQNYRVGLFNSPQLLHYNERVRINSAVLSDDTHVKAFGYIEQNRGDISLTEFEFSTLAALKIFADAALDIVILEVGMGGRLDSTNIVTPDVSVITTIDIDHQAFLGDNREAIGYQKSGIFRENTAAIIGEFNIPESVLNHGKSINAQLHCANRDFSITKDQQLWHWQSDSVRINDLIEGHIPMQNVSTALKVLQTLDIALCKDSINGVLSSLVVEGRFAMISDSPMIIVDVAHNPQSAAYLATQLADLAKQGYSNVSAVVGMLKDKDIEQVFASVNQQVSRWYLVDLPVKRGASSAQLAQSLEKLQVTHFSCYDCVATGLQQAKEELDDKGLIIIFGSFHTVAAVLPTI